MPSSSLIVVVLLTSLLLILLPLTCIHVVDAQQQPLPTVIDVTSTTGDRTFEQTTYNDPNGILFSGSVPASATLRLHSLQFSATTKAIINITLSEKATLDILNSTFPLSLHLFTRLATPTAATRVVLRDCVISCSGTGMEQKCARWTQQNPAPANGTFAFLHEIARLPQQVLKASAGEVSLELRNTNVSIVDSGTPSPSTSLVAIAVQGQEFYRLAAASSNLIGAGIPKGSTTATPHGTVLPFARVFISGGEITCDSDRGSSNVGEGYSPVFVACVTVGSGDRTPNDWRAEQARDQSKAAQSVDYRGVKWPVGFLLDTLVVSKSFIHGTCTGTSCAGVVVGEALLQRVAVRDSRIEFSRCYDSCAGVAIVSSYGDNFTRPVSTTTVVSTTSSPSSPTSPNQTSTTTVAPSSSSMTTTSSDQFPSSSASAFIISNTRFTMTQGTPYADTDSSHSAVVTRFSDISFVRILGNTVRLAAMSARTRLLNSPFISRCDGGILVAGGNDVATETKYGSYQAATLHPRFLYQIGGGFNVSDLAVDMRGSYMKLSLLGIEFLEHFGSAGINLRNVSVAITIPSANDGGVIVFERVAYGGGFLMSGVTMNINTRNNVAVLFFDDGLVEDVPRGFVLEDVKVISTPGTVGNVLFLNSTFRRVSEMRMSRFSYTSLTPPGGYDTTVFIGTLLAVGLERIVIEDGTVDMTCGICGLLNVLSIGNANPHSLQFPRTPIIVRNLKAVGSADKISTGGLIFLAAANSRDYGADAVASPVVGRPTGRCAPISFVNVTYGISAPILSLLFGVNILIDALVLRSSSFPGTSLLMSLPFSGAPTELSSFDASGFPCSTVGLTKLDTTAKVRSLSLPTKSRLNRARHCGESLSRSLSRNTESYYFRPKPTVTLTFHNLTNTSTKSKTKSLTASLMPPPLDLNPPAAAAALGTTASILGAGAGAAVALDAARAVAVASLAAQCREYDRAGKGLSDEQRRKNFYKTYLTTKPGWPANFFQLCFGPEVGACIRGSIVSALIAHVVMAILIYFGIGRPILLSRIGAMSETEKLAASAWTYAKAPFFLGMMFAFVIGPWSTAAIVLLRVPDLPDSDALLGVLSICLWIVLIGIGFFRLFWPRLNKYPEIFHMEESLTMFEAEDPDKRRRELEREMMLWEHQQRMMQQNQQNQQQQSEQNTSSNSNNKNKTQQQVLSSSGDDDEDDDDLLLFGSDNDADLNAAAAAYARQSRNNKNKNNNNNGARNLLHSSGSARRRGTTTSTTAAAEDQPTSPPAFLREPPPPEASSFQRFVFSCTQFLPTDLGRILILGRYIWTQEFPTEDEPQSATSIANGNPGSMLWNCGTLINKYRGPYTKDEPLVKRSRKRREAERDLFIEKIMVRGVATRRYHMTDFRMKVSPFYCFVSLGFTLAVCIAQGIALSDPSRCSSTIKAIAGLNIAAWLSDLYFQPYLVPSRNAIVILAGAFLSGSSCISAFGDPTDTEMVEVASVFSLIFIVLMLTVCLFNVALKAILFFGRGTILIRREVLRKLDAVLVEKELEMIVLGAGRSSTAGVGSKIIRIKDDKTKRAEEEREQRRVQELLAMRDRTHHGAMSDTLFGSLGSAAAYAML